MTMLFLAPHLKGDSWLKHIRREGPDIELRVWPDAGRVEDVVFALCWKHPLGELKKYPNLKCIASLGFGVDHVLRDPDLPAGVPVTRIVDAGDGRRDERVRSGGRAHAYSGVQPLPPGPGAKKMVGAHCEAAARRPGGDHGPGASRGRCSSQAAGPGVRGFRLEPHRPPDGGGAVLCGRLGVRAVSRTKQTS